MYLGINLKKYPHTGEHYVSLYVGIVSPISKLAGVAMTETYVLAIQPICPAKLPELLTNSAILNPSGFSMS